MIYIFLPLPGGHITSSAPIDLNNFWAIQEPPDYPFSYPILWHLCPTYQNIQNVVQGLLSSVSKRHINVSVTILVEKKKSSPRLSPFYWCRPSCQRSRLLASSRRYVILSVVIFHISRPELACLWNTSSIQTTTRQVLICFCTGTRSDFLSLSRGMRMRRSHCWHNVAKAAVFIHVQKLIVRPRPVMPLNVIAIEVCGGVQLLAP